LFIFRERCAEVEVLDVGSEQFSVFRYNFIEEGLDNFHLGGVGG
jgi:hypothetical protein